jgi:toxin ParE1/3/4
MAEYEVKLLPAAFSDLDEIFDYILTENPEAAVRTLENIMQSLGRLKNHPYSCPPLIGHSLNRFNFRMLVVSPYIAFYRVIDNEVLIYRVLHGARNYPPLLKES